MSLFRCRRSSRSRLPTNSDWTYPLFLEHNQKDQIAMEQASHKPLVLQAVKVRLYLPIAVVLCPPTCTNNACRFSVS